MAAGAAELDPVWDDMERYVTAQLRRALRMLTVTSGPSDSCSWQVTLATCIIDQSLIIRSLDGLRGYRRYSTDPKTHQ